LKFMKRAEGVFSVSMPRQSDAASKVPRLNLELMKPKMVGNKNECQAQSAVTERKDRLVETSVNTLQRSQTPRIDARRPKKAVRPTVPKPFNFATENRGRIRQPPKSMGSSDDVMMPCMQAPQKTPRPVSPKDEFEVCEESMAQIVSQVPIPLEVVEKRASTAGRSRQSGVHQVRFSLHAGSGGSKAVEGFGPSAQLREEQRRAYKRPHESNSASPSKRRQSSYMMLPSHHTAEVATVHEAQEMDIDEKMDERTTAHWMAECAKLGKTQLTVSKENCCLLNKEKELTEENLNLKRENKALMHQVAELKDMNESLKAHLREPYVADASPKSKGCMSSESDTDEEIAGELTAELSTLPTTQAAAVNWVARVPVVHPEQLIQNIRSALSGVKSQTEVFAKLEDNDTPGKITRESFLEKVNEVCCLKTPMNYAQKAEVWKALQKANSVKPNGGMTSASFRHTFFSE